MVGSLPPQAVCPQYVEAMLIAFSVGSARVCVTHPADAAVVPAKLLSAIRAAVVRKILGADGRAEKSLGESIVLFRFGWWGVAWLQDTIVGSQYLGSAEIFMFWCGLVRGWCLGWQGGCFASREVASVAASTWGFGMDAARARESWG